MASEIKSENPLYHTKNCKKNSIWPILHTWQLFA